MEKSNSVERPPSLKRRKRFAKKALTFSLGEAAAIIGKKREGLRRWIKTGMLKYEEDYFLTITGRYRIRGSWLEKVAHIREND